MNFFKKFSVQILVMALLCTSYCFSIEFELKQTLTGDIPGSPVPPLLGDGFGQTVSIDDGYLVTTAPNAYTDSITNAGALYFYKKENGVFEVSQNTFSENIENDLPGVFQSLHVNDKWLMASVGDTTFSDNLTPTPQHPGGAVVVFHRHDGKWKHVQTLQPSDLVAGDQFGARSLTFDGNWAFISAYRQQVGSIAQAGAVYVFHLNEETKQWEFTQKITQPGGAQAQGRFGEGAILHDKYAFIGATGNYFSGLNGTAYFYHLEHGQWVNTQTLLPDVRGPYLFGFSLDFNKDWAIIGSAIDSTVGPLAGAVYFYRSIEVDGEKQWQFVQKSFTDQVNGQNAVGSHVLLDKNYAYVNDNRDSPDGTLKHTGAVLVFHEKDGSWSHINTILNPNPRALDFFGSNFSIWRSNLVIGENTNLDFYQPYADIIPPLNWSLTTTHAPNGRVFIYKIKK